MTLWIVGRAVGTERAFEFQGVFSSEAIAVAACKDETYFIGPATLDEELPHETMTDNWPGSYYPKLVAQ